MELLVDPTDATYGRFCLVDVDTPTVQRFSCILDDPAAGGSPGVTMQPGLVFPALDTERAAAVRLLAAVLQGLAAPVQRA